MLTEGVIEAPALAPRPKRWKARWGFVVAGLAIAAAVIYLVIANTGTSAEYYMTIHELQSCSACSGQSVRVAGFVTTSGVTKLDGGAQGVTFKITDTATQLTPEMAVSYQGIVPDTVRAGTQVVVEGHFAHGVFQATTLLAKCPSKFQAATPGATISGGGQ
ncbi:MAG TPA: cytochrome c maturation protein CcmE [Ktedonobacterales bacterium]|nr:cytochrome c maturation protein CcmE [Ktedonobacterales bacterium]